VPSSFKDLQRLGFLIEDVSPFGAAIRCLGSNPTFLVPFAVAVTLRFALGGKLVEFLYAHFSTRYLILVSGLELEVFVNNRGPACVLIEQHLQHALQVSLEVTAIQFHKLRTESGRDMNPSGDTVLRTCRHQ
jgi:hypothetical protein